MTKRVSAFSLSLGLLVVLGSLFSANPTSATVNANDWQAGNIIDDTLFYDGNAMSVTEIQSFLNSLVPVCDTWGAQPHETIPGKTRAQVGTEYSNPPPYICVKDYYENPTTKETNFNPTASVPTGAVSAAQIIYNAAQEFKINPKALLVTIKKEAANNLLEDSWPWKGQYRTALGYGCPDTAACDSQYYGFYNQVRNAARQFRLYADYPEQYRRKAGAVHSIQYHPFNNCESPSVYLQNKATAGLYNYTPYQPNQAALTNMPGAGDSCSSYGNRNFWYIWNKWFGRTTGYRVKGLIGERYNLLGGESGGMGLPTGPEIKRPGEIYWQDFENGVIIGRYDTGFWENKGLIRKRWGELGYQGGKMGLPTGPEINSSSDVGVIYQHYQHGTIFADTTTDSVSEVMN